MSAVRGSASLTQDGLRCTGVPAVPGDWGLRVERPSPDSFLMIQEFPHDRPLYYRVDHGRVDWAEDPTALLNGLAPPPPDASTLLAMIHGIMPDPTASFLPGVQRLAAGSVVRLDASGATVTRSDPQLVDTGTSFRTAVRRALEQLGDGYAVAFSGGLSSAFAAVCAVEAGHRPVLLHADFGGREPVALPAIPGLRIEHVRTDVAELLDQHRITGCERVPPLPDVEVPRRLVERLRAHASGPIVAGSLLETLASVRLPDVAKGARDWRLLSCEPFHAVGVLRTLAEARELIERSGAHASPAGGHEVPDVPPAGPGSHPDPTSGGPGLLPGLTDQGADACAAAQRGMLAMWKSRLDSVAPIIGQVDAGLAERGSGGAALPALDPAVLAAAAALPPGEVGRIRGGLFQNHLPMHRALAEHRVAAVRRRPPGHWLRLAAADYLYRDRDKLADQMRRDCALGDLGLIDPSVTARLLHDGRELAARALPLLRLVWVDQWLRGRS